ncbi:MAG: hypothetical protein HY664_01835 [Chloroflexi bacterium]|nr:hypothetical protein [Chloroflexota bacterium]
MPKFKNGLDWPTAIIVGFLSQDPEIDQEEVVKLAIYLTMRESGWGEESLVDYVRPDMSLISKFVMPEELSPEMVWQWRRAGLGVLGEANNALSEKGTLGNIGMGAFKTSLWVQALSGKMLKEHNLCVEATNKALHSL